MMPDSENFEGAGEGGKPSPVLGRLGALVAGSSPYDESQTIKKPNDAISLRVIGELRMDFQHRKLFNALIRVAQEERQPGKRLPPSAQSSPPEVLEKMRQYFWAPLEEFVRDARYDSNDVAQLKQSIDELQRLRVISTGGDWVSEVPISSVRFHTERGRSTWVGIAVAPETHSLLLRPRQYTEIQLQMQRQLNSGPAIALYERCRQYLTSPGHKTPREPWSDWYYLLSGQPTSRPLPQYKYWNRDTLKRVEAEINALTDIRIKRVEFRVGRQVEDLQYEVFPNEQTAISFPGDPPIDTELRDRILKLNVPPERADRLMAEYDSGLLRANLAYTEQAHRSGVIRGKPISYLEAALRKNYAGNVATAKATLAALQPEAASENAVKDEYLRERARKALELFNELDLNDREQTLKSFLQQSNDLMREQFRRGGIDAPLVRSSFAIHYAQVKWGEPSSDELLHFANSRLANRNAGR